MSEDKSPENATPQNSTSAGIKFALLAGVLGIAVGAGLYAFSGGKDKSQGTQVATAETPASSSCAFNKAIAEKLNSAATGQIAGFTALDRGYSAASMSFKDKDGNPKTLSDWKGRTVLLNLWATWCPPCRAEMPSLDKLQKDLGSDKFEVVTISIDKGDDTRPKKFFQKIAIADLGFYHDPSTATLLTLKKNGLALGLPATILVGTDGCVLGGLNGPAEWASDDAKALIKAALKGS